MVRKGLIVVILFGSVIFLAYYLSQPKPLRPIIVTWQEVGTVWSFVDLDMDGNNELLVQDEDKQWWWVHFRPTATVRQKIPVPKEVHLEDEVFISDRAQLLAFCDFQTEQGFLIAWQSEKWLAKNLGKLKRNEDLVVCDADGDGKVNDVVLWRGQIWTVFSRMKDGTIVERTNLPNFQADFDGDGKDDAVYIVRGEVSVHLSSGHKTSLKTYAFPIATIDMDGDKVSEIVGVEWIMGNEWYFRCWRYENGRWRESSSPKLGGINWSVINDDALGKLTPFRDEKGTYLLAVTKDDKQVEVWEVRWQKGKWKKKLMGEVPEHFAESKHSIDDFGFVDFMRVGRDWIVVGKVSPPKWQEWLWEKLGKHSQRFLTFLQKPQARLFVYGWDGKQKWNLLGRWSGKTFTDFCLADMDGDGKREFSIAFQRKVLVAKFEDRQWCKVWVKVPFVEYGTKIYGFRYGGREWAIYQEWDSHRCVAIALENDSERRRSPK